MPKPMAMPADLAKVIALHREMFGGWKMQADENQAAPERPAEKQSQESRDEKAAERTFTQAELDQIVQQRIARERDKFSDYDDLKQRASEAKTVEEQLAELRSQNEAIQRESLRNRVAAEYGIAPADADLMLTGKDEETLTAQAKRLQEHIARENASRPHDRVPHDRGNPRVEDSDDAVARKFFGL